MDLLLYVVLGVLLLASSFAATLVYNHKHHHPEIVVVDSRKGHVITGPRKVPPGGTPKPQMTRTEQAAFNAGRKDVVKGWIGWAKCTTATEREEEAAKHAEMRKTEKGRQQLETMQALARNGYGRRRWDSVYLTDHYGDSRKDKAEKLLSQVPTSEWSLHHLRDHLSEVSIYCMEDGSMSAAGEQRKRFTAAMITDRVSETYDPSKADVTAEYAYHEDHRTQARYLEGRAKGTEDIMDAITAARTRNREIGAASEAIAAANQRHAAALRALRETTQSTAAPDQHKDYDTQFKALEAGDQ